MAVVLTKPVLSSPAFADGGQLPRQYGCDGDGISPPLKFDGVGNEAKGLTLILDDPDAPSGTYTHWVMYDIPADTRELHPGIEPRGTLPSGAHQGRNSARTIGYTPPCPPAGPAHRYFFHLYVLDRTLGLGEGATRDAVIDAMQGHILGESQIMATYRRG